jgi:hypothetical protein
MQNTKPTYAIEHEATEITENGTNRGCLITKTAFWSRWRLRVMLGAYTRGPFGAQVRAYAPSPLFNYRATACHTVLIESGCFSGGSTETARTLIFPLRMRNRVISWRKKFIVFFVSESCLPRKNRVFEKSGSCFFRVSPIRNRAFFVSVSGDRVFPTGRTRRFHS